MTVMRECAVEGEVYLVGIYLGPKKSGIIAGNYDTNYYLFCLFIKLLGAYYVDAMTHSVVVA